MPYVGRGLTTGAQYQKLDAIAINNATTFTMSVGSANVSPDQNHLILVVNGVIQEPGTGFTVSGSTCTLASAITTSGHSGTDTIYGVIAGDAAFAAYDSIGANALGVTAGTVTASRAIVPDSNKDIASFRNVTLTGELDAATLDISGNADIDGTTNLDAVDIDGAVQVDNTITVGADDQGYDVKFFGDTASAYMLWDTSADDLVLAGAAGIDLAGDLDVDGTANLDVVDIDGAVDMASTLGVTGVVTANAGVVVDNITIDGTEIDLSSGNLTLDVAGDIILDADGGDIYFEDAGTTIGHFQNSSSDFVIKSSASDKDIIFKGNDGGSTITAMTIDMSEGGRVGIGCTPSAVLQVKSPSSRGTGTGIALERTGGSNLVCDLYETSGGQGELILRDVATTNVHLSANTATDNFILGDLGIGTTSPAEMLHLKSTTASKPVIKLEQAQSGGHGTSEAPKIVFYQNDDDQDGISDNSDLGAIDFRGDDKDGGSDALYASIRGVAQDPNTHHQGAIDFYTNQSSSSGLVNAMRVYYNGNIGIGNIAPDRRLVVEGNAAADYVASFRNEGNNANRYGIIIYAGADDGSGTTDYISCQDGDGTQVGYIRNTSATFALTDASDRRLKENIRDTEVKGLDAVSSMKVRDFEWKKSGETCIGGFVAQELKSAFAPAVSGEDGALEEDGGIKPMGVSRDVLVPVLVKAIQELTAKVEALENA